MTPFLKIDHLSKLFPKSQKASLKEITATLKEGKIIGLVGPDGAGKTTLIRLLAGLLRPTDGSISLQGLDSVTNAGAIQEKIGYMPQRFGLYEDLTVLQNLNLYADLRGLVGEERKTTFEKLLSFTGLGSFTGRKSGALSGGMKQKLGLACALIKKPTLLLLDEPSVGVDPVSRKELWKMVESLISEGISVIWSTAYLDEAEKCSEVLLLNEGKLIFFGNPQELSNRVAGRTFEVLGVEDRRSTLKELLGMSSILDGVIQGRSIRIVLRQGSTPPTQFTTKSVAPRFEDGFMDILGGGPGGDSSLAKNASVITDTTPHVIVAKDLTKRFGSFTAADRISLEVKRGEIFGLLGPNGAGKTTTFKMLCGLLRPTSGQASVNGVDLLKASSQARQHIGYMAQKFSLYGNLSVLQNLQFFAGIYQAPPGSVEKMVGIFNFQDFLTQTADALPLGFKQRLSLACANLHQPEVLFLDEPTSGVDPITRREFWNHINGLVSKGVTIMVTTHFMEEAEYCDRIALVYQGKIIHLDTPNTLKKKIQSELNPNPTLEDVFIQSVEGYERK